MLSVLVCDIVLYMSREILDAIEMLMIVDMFCDGYCLLLDSGHVLVIWKMLTNLC